MSDPHVLKVRVNATVGALQLDVQFATRSSWTVLFGPSGSGKSSILRLITGLWAPHDAAVFLNAVPLASVPARKRHIGMVSQQPALFPHMTVEENILFGCDGANRKSWLAELLDAFGLIKLAKASPAALSGGERQRVALARALGPRPQYLLLDEVFTGMHAPQRQQLIPTLRSYSERLSMPVLSVTHDIPEALQADEVLKLQDGRITAQGFPGMVLAREREDLLSELA